MKKVKDRTLKLCDEVELTLYEEGGKYYVDSKQLYEWLEVKTPYAKWFSRRIKQYKFKEENDYLMYYYKDDFNKLNADKIVHVNNVENTKNINCKNLIKLKRQ